MKLKYKFGILISMLITTICWGSHIYAIDEGYMDIQMDKTVAYDGDEVIVSVTTKKALTDYELTFSSSILDRNVEVMNEMTGSRVTSNGRNKILYYFQFVSQADKVLLPIGTELAKVKYTIPSNYWLNNRTGNSTAQFNVDLGIKLTNVAANCTYNLSKNITIANPIYGDITNDGVVNAADIQKLEQYLAVTISLTNQEQRNADVNKDDIINIIDLYIIKEYVGENITTLPHTDGGLYLYNSSVVYTLNENSKATVVYWNDQNVEKTKYVIPDKLESYDVIGITSFESRGTTFVLPSGLNIVSGIINGTTIITDKRNSLIANAVRLSGATYVVTGEALEEKLKNITRNNNAVEEYLNLPEDIDPDLGLNVIAKNKEGEILLPTAKLGTGSEIIIVDADENIISREIISINGEINGDGEVDFFDITELIELVYDVPETYEWEEPVRKAGTFGEQEGTPDFFNITRLISYIYDEI